MYTESDINEILDGYNAELNELYDHSLTCMRDQSIDF